MMNPKRRPVEPITDEWIAWLQRSLADAQLDNTVRLTIEHRVKRSNGSEFRWHVRVADGIATATAGSASDGDSLLIFTSEYETARAIASGEESAQRAFLEGRLRVDGDVRLLIKARPTLEALSIASI